MELRRKPFQGVLNIIRFNRHFYLMAGVVFIALILLKNLFPQAVQNLILTGVAMAASAIVISLLISFYIYDLSDLYQLKWLNGFDNKAGSKILNINAGFDETSAILRRKLSNADLTVCDFYNPVKHTAVSIKRARKAYPPNPETIAVKTDQLPFPANAFDNAFAILSAHEIKDKKEKVQFFKELGRITKSSGQIVVTEHLRDLYNFLAYTIGFLHFQSKTSWLQTFKQAGLTVKQEIKTTPFITTFILEKYGNTH